jgi:hypothetical protein
VTNLDFDIFGRDHGLGRTLEDLNRKVKSLENVLKELDRTDANPSVRIEQITEAKRQIKDLQNDLRQLDNVRLRIDADTTAARRDINAAKRDLDELYARAAQGEDVELEIAQAEARLNELKAKMAALKDLKFNADADIAAAKAKFAELEAIVKGIGDVHINVDADVGGATAKLTALQTVMRAVTNNTSTFGTAFRTAATIIGAGASALGGFTSGMGSFVSAIGGGVNVISGLGNAISSIGSSLTSGGQALTQFGSAASGAFSSLASAGASVAGIVVQLSALASVGTLVVGALGQIGGAAIALGSGIVPLVQSLGLLPGLISPLVVGFGALVIGFSNAGEKGLEFKNTMDQLKNAFTPVIDSIRSQMQPAIQNLLNSFTGLAPVIQAVVPQITSAVSEVANSFAQLFNSSQFKNDFQQILTQAANNFKAFGNIGKNAIQGIMNVMIAANPAVERFLQFIDQGVQKWNAWTAAARQSGELTQIFQQAEQALEQIMSTIGNVAGLFKDLWDSANRTGAFQSTLQAINQGITQFRQYVQDAGGAWDQLMSKAGTITQSLVGLVGAIGNAFVTLGSQMDISGVIDTITQAINNMTPAFAQIGQAATPVFETIIEVAGRAAQALGPALSQAITAIGTALKSIDWESVITGIARVIQGFTNLINGAIKAGEVLNTLSSFLEGEGASWANVKAKWSEFVSAISDESGVEAAKRSVEGLNAAIQGIKPPAPITFTADASQATAAADSVKGKVDEVPKNPNVVFAGDVAQALAQIGLLTPAINNVPKNPPETEVTFGADVAQALSQIGLLSPAVEAVPKAPPPTVLTADVLQALAQVGLVSPAIETVTGVEHKAMITADASGVQAGVTQATGSLGTVQDKAVNITATDNVTSVATTANNALAGIVDKNINISATNNDLIIPAQGAVDALAAIVDKDVKITANNQQAIQAIQQVQQYLNSLQDKTVTVTVQTVQAGAGGMITQPMAQGGITYSNQLGRYLPMAAGGSLMGHRLTPMSGSRAAIVPANTWRVIGDRPTGPEAFIPINHSASSRALLNETAKRMGQMIVPRSAVHFHRGGFWDWWRRRRPSGHRFTSAEAELGYGITGVPLNQIFQNRDPRSIGFGAGSARLSGTAMPLRSTAVTNTLGVTPPSVPSVPSGGGRGGSGGSTRVILDPGASQLGALLLQILRNSIRIQGGDVQLVLGS